MTFSYDPTLADDISRVRFRIGDTTENKGALPNGANISNEEITATISYEGSWQRAVAAGFERLAATWATHVSYSSTTVGHSESRQNANVAAEFRKQADIWRGQYGYIGDDQDANRDVPSVSIGMVSFGFQSELE